MEAALLPTDPELSFSSSVIPIRVRMSAIFPTVIRLRPVSFVISARVILGE